jgi:ATPase family AAA domain-containing protein 3A/B
MRRETEREMQTKRQEYEELIDKRKAETELEKIRVELQERAASERANEDIQLRKLRAQAEEDTRRTVQAINAIASHLLTFLTELLTDRARLTAILGSLAALIAGYFTVKELAALVRTLVLRYVGRPQLVRETSVRRSLFDWWAKLGQSDVQRAEQVSSHFFDVVLNAQDKKRILQIALSTYNARRNGAPYRHLLLYGPPGTGKTMVAKRLALSSGMDYAIMSGGDVAPLGKDGVTELHRLFRWAKSSRKGLLLFIDEAEAFLGSRSREQLSESTRNALNALLYNTGSESRHFMLVLATNRAGDLDKAVLDRMDESVLFTFPNDKERKELLLQYYDMYIARRIRNANARSQLLKMVYKEPTYTVAPEVTPASLERLADGLQGFSGRGIAKAMIRVLDAMYASADRTLTLAIVIEALRAKRFEHEEKLRMLSATTADKRANDRS